MKYFFISYYEYYYSPSDILTKPWYCFINSAVSISVINNYQHQTGVSMFDCLQELRGSKQAIAHRKRSLNISLNRFVNIFSANMIVRWRVLILNDLFVFENRICPRYFDYSPLDSICVAVRSYLCASKLQTTSNNLLFILLCKYTKGG